MADRKYVTLISGDGFEFSLIREAAMVSPFIKGMLRHNMREGQTGQCRLEEIKAPVLEKVVEYMLYWYKYRDKEHVPDMDIPVEMCLEVLVAADYLGLDK